MEQKQVTLEEFNQIKKELANLKKQVSDLGSLKEDLEFLKSVDEGWEGYDRGEVVEVSREDISKELKKW